MSGQRRHQLLIYGANGYTGRRLTGQALRSGLDVFLCGRNREEIARLAAETRAPCGIVELKDRELLDRVLGDADIVLNAAGPMAATAPPLIAAAIRCGTHYLDVAGEMAVFTHAYEQDARAREAGVMLMPGVGFGIVASDCLAAAVAERCPEAVFLRIALTVPQRLSRGSVLTALSMSEKSVVVRRGGKLIKRTVGRLERRFDYGNGEAISSAITWPDVFTAFLSTGIPNCEVYAEANWAERWWYQVGSWTAPVLRHQSLRELADAASPHPAGDDPGEQIVVAEAEDPWRRTTSLRAVTRGGYEFTEYSAIEVAKRIIAGKHTAGFQTPSQAYGSDLLFSIPGSILLN